MAADLKDSQELKELSENNLSQVLKDPSTIGWEFVPEHGDLKTLQEMMNDPQSTKSVQLRRIQDSKKEDSSQEPKPNKANLSLQSSAIEHKHEKEDSTLKSSLKSIDSENEDEDVKPELVSIIFTRTEHIFTNEKTEKIIRLGNKPMTCFMFFKDIHNHNNPLKKYYELENEIDESNTYLCNFRLDKSDSRAPFVWENPDFNGHLFLAMQLEGLRLHFVDRVFNRMMKIEVFNNKKEAQYFKLICGHKKNTKVEQDLFDSLTEALKKSEIQGDFSTAIETARKIHQASIQENENRGLEYLTISGTLYCWDEMVALYDLGNSLAAQHPEWAIKAFESITLHSSYYYLAQRHCSDLNFQLATGQKIEKEAQKYLEKAMIHLFNALNHPSNSYQETLSDIELLSTIIETYCGKNPMHSQGFLNITPLSNYQEFIENLKDTFLDISDKIREQSEELFGRPSQLQSTLAPLANLPLPTTELKIQSEETLVAPLIKLDHPLPGWKKVAGDLAKFHSPGIHEIEFARENENEDLKADAEGRILKQVFLKNDVTTPFMDIEGKLIPSLERPLVILVFKNSGNQLENEVFTKDFPILSSLKNPLRKKPVTSDEVSFNFEDYDCSYTFNLPKVLLDKKDTLKDHSYVVFKVSDMRLEIRNEFFSCLPSTAACFAPLCGYKPISAEEFGGLKDMRLAYSQGNYEEAIELAKSLDSSLDAVYCLGLALKDISPLLAYRTLSCLVSEDGSSIYADKARFVIRDLIPILLKLEHLDPQERRQIIKNGFFNLLSPGSADTNLKLIAQNCGYTGEAAINLWSQISLPKTSEEIGSFFAKIIITLLDKINENEALLLIKRKENEKKEEKSDIKDPKLAKPVTFSSESHAVANSSVVTPPTVSVNETSNQSSDNPKDKEPLTKASL